MKYGILILFTVLAVVACNKNKYNSKKLQKGEVWEVSKLKINGELHKFVGVWEITTDTDVCEEVPRFLWNLNNEEDAICEWQFQDKAKKFQINYIQLCEECDGDQLDSLDYLAHAISGEYTVLERKRKSMEFESSNTRGYPGKTVELKIIKQ